MIARVFTGTAAVAGCGLFILFGQSQERPAVFTAAQAEAGRAVFQSRQLGSFSGHRCAECHSPTLLGNDGTGDVPEWRHTFKSVVVPPLAGKDFMAKWGARTTKDLYTRIQGVTPLDEETYLDLVAYILASNGARAGSQPLTTATVVEIRSAAADAVPERQPF
jgi:hypothetical protein